MELKARELSISTCTITTHINCNVDLSLISRYNNIYNYTNKILDLKNGGLFHQEYINDYPRTNLSISVLKLLKKTNKYNKKEFNNQSTLNFKYYNSHRVNIKLFTNGRLELTGIKTEYEAEYVSNCLINILKSIEIPIYYDVLPNPTYIEDQNIPNIALSHHYFLTYTKNISNTSNNLNDGKLDYVRYLKLTNKMYTSLEFEKLVESKKLEITTMKKNITSIVTGIKWEILSCIEWNKLLIHKKKFIIEIMAQFIKVLPGILLNISLFDNSNNYLEFRSLFLEELNKQITNYMVKKIYDYKKLEKVYKEDNLILEKIKLNSSIISRLINANNIYKFKIDDINLSNSHHKYKVSNIETHLINSDYNVNFFINLDELVKVLTSYGIFNYYNPNSYPGILAKFYYNPNNIVQGICNCDRHCSTREKKSICTKITICIFRPGSIIITGSKSIVQLTNTYSIINSILFDHYNNIKGIIMDDDIKQNSFQNNTLRKIGRRDSILYFPKSRLIIK